MTVAGGWASTICFGWEQKKEKSRSSQLSLKISSISDLSDLVALLTFDPSKVIIQVRIQTAINPIDPSSANMIFSFEMISTKAKEEFFFREKVGGFVLWVAAGYGLSAQKITPIFHVGQSPK